MTLHSFAGMGSGEATLERCVQMATKNASQNWRRCKHLVIDEISMVDGQYFEVFIIYYFIHNLILNFYFKFYFFNKD